MTRALSRRKRAAFAVVTVALSLLATVAGLGVTDVWLRHHYRATLGLNTWGYRGPVVGAKSSGERRVVMLGGSTVFGFGVSPTQTIAAYLERDLRAAWRGGPVTVVNLGYVREGAWSFRATLEDYAYLDYDVAILYEGYNDLRRPNTRSFRRDSPVFRLTGYLPILPIVLDEKARAIRYGGDLGERFGREDPVFRPGLAARATSGALKAAAEVTRALERTLGPFSRASRPTPSEAPTSCGEPFSGYCDTVRAAVEETLFRGARVLIVSQPYISDTHVAQQAHLAALLQERFGRDRRVIYLDLGSALDLRDPEFAWDGMHLTPSGNALLAERLVAPVMSVLGSP